jgi:hypothetical protein
MRDLPRTRSRSPLCPAAPVRLVRDGPAPDRGKQMWLAAMTDATHYAQMHPKSRWQAPYNAPSCPTLARCVGTTTSCI